MLDKKKILSDFFCDTVIELTLDGIVQSWNIRAENMFEDCPDEIIGQPFVKLLPTDHHRDFYNILEKLQDKGEIQHFESTTANKDGTFKNIFMDILPSRDAAGKSPWIYVVLKDITRINRLMTEARLLSHIASIGQLATSVAHQINNPINGIINYAQILKDEFREQGISNEIPERIIKESDRIVNITKSLLTIAGKTEYRESSANISNIVHDVILLVENQLLKSRIGVKLDISPNMPDVIVCYQEIQHAFLNIINNARDALNRKFSGSNDDKTLRISVELISKGGRHHVRTLFHDKGEGIPCNILDKISTPFFTSRPIGQGMGLGLSMASEIINKHGGKLSVESEEGMFTKVIVDLPIEKMAVTQN